VAALVADQKSVIIAGNGVMGVFVPGEHSMTLSRRSVLRAAAAALVTPAMRALAGALGAAPFAGEAKAQAPAWRHGLSLFGAPKYPATFKHFDYVNPVAPQGGMVRQIAFGTFDNFNMVVSGVKGSLANGLEFISETLSTPALDEVSTEYGLLAEGMSFPPDRSAVTYRLRSQARWHDGKPVTPEDVIYSFDTFKQNSPQLAAYYRHVSKAEKSGERDVTFIFDGPGNRELPQIVGQLTVLPKHWWEGNDAKGKKRSITETTLEPPLGSGPYKLKDFSPGHTLVYERVADYWGNDLNVNIGANNFAQIRYEYYRDSDVAMQAFKGDRVDWRSENSAKNWATAYDFPAVREKKVVLEEFPIRNFGMMQAFAFNIRRDKFKDPRVRRAFNFAFDFHAMNKQIFYGQYTRIASYFQGTELASTGIPQGEELAILQSVRGQLPADERDKEMPPDLFTGPYTNPVSDTPQKVRDNLREALKLFRAAGYVIKDTKLVDAKTGAPYSVEFLVEDTATERFVLFYKPSLQRIGMVVNVRLVDSAQYENRLRQWDFDIVIANWGESLSPGNEQRGYWGSAAADEAGSRNLVGIKNKAIDMLIERVIYAKDRAGLVAATHALDRVLLWNYYVVPQWTYGKVRTARWDRFGRPQHMPKYGLSAFPTIWWWDKEKAAKVPRRT
jgi:microcin C transport system substrate-binding protein